MDQKLQKIGIVTSGGDAPGMNSCIRAVAREAAANNYRFDSLVLGVVRSAPFQMRTASQKKPD